jgi:ArsR family transcriptional regulator, arsenate/arsenite/antimonite-responsive transcriptional repressor
MIDVHRFRFDTGAVPKPLPLIDPSPDLAACCAPLAASPLSVGQAQELAVRLKAMADPARLRLLSLLLASENLEACTCDLTGPLGLSQPTVTHHLRKLLEAGLVSAERRGVWTYYRVVPTALTALADVLAPARASGRPGSFSQGAGQD